MSDTYAAGHSCPETLPHDAQLGAVVFQPRMRCQRLGATVVARQVQKEEAWLPYQLGYFWGLQKQSFWNCTMMSGTVASITSRASVSWWIPLMA